MFLRIFILKMKPFFGNKLSISFLNFLFIYKYNLFNHPFYFIIFILAFIGGALGLFMGISCVNFIEIFEFIDDIKIKINIYL